MTEIRPGAMLMIPPGADLSRKRPYLLGVHTIARVDNQAGTVHVWGDAYTLDGKPVSAPGVLGRYAVLVPAKVRPVTVPRKRGGQPKLSPAQKREAKAARDAGASVTDLAVRYQVHRVTMSKILKNEAMAS